MAAVTNLGRVAPPPKAAADPLLTEDPQQSYQRALAGMLAQQATDSSPVYGWGGAAGRALAGLGAGYFTGRASEDEHAAAQRDAETRIAVRNAFNNPPEGMTPEDAAFDAAKRSPRVLKMLSDESIKDIGRERFEPVKNGQGVTIGQKSTKSGKLEYFGLQSQGEGATMVGPDGTLINPARPKTEPGIQINPQTGRAEAVEGYGEAAGGLAGAKKEGEYAVDLRWRPQIETALTPAMVDRHRQTAGIDFGNSSSLQGQAAANALNLQQQGFQNTLNTPQSYHEGTTVTTPRQLGFGGGGPLPALATAGGGGSAQRPGLFAGAQAPVVPPVAGAGTPPAPQPMPPQGALPLLAQAGRLPMPPVNAAPRQPVQASPLQPPEPVQQPAAPAVTPQAAPTAPPLAQPAPNGGVLIGGNGAQRAGAVAEQQHYGETLGKESGGVVSAGDKAAQTIEQIRWMRNIADEWRRGNGSQGALGTPTAWLAGKLQSIGMNPGDAAGLPNSAGPAEIIEALSRKMAMGSIGAGGIPANNFSDADRKYLDSVQPHLGDRPEAWEAKLLLMERVAERDQVKRDMWLNRPDGQGYEAFLKTTWAPYVKATPTFTDADRQAIRTAAGENQPPPVITRNAQQREKVPPAPRDATQRQPGQVYTGANGQRVLWDGRGFLPAPQ